MRSYTSIEPIINLLTKIDFENIEKSIQQDSYLRIRQEIKPCIPNGISCKCVIFKDKSPETVGICPKITFIFLLRNKSIYLSLSSIENNIKFEKLETGIIFYQISKIIVIKFE